MIDFVIDVVGLAVAIFVGSAAYDWYRHRRL
jgi:hypothetical protein